MINQFPRAAGGPFARLCGTQGAGDAADQPPAHRIKRGPRVTSAAILALAAAVCGCGPKSEQDLIAAARDSIANRDQAAAVVQLKAALQQHPQSAQARYLLGSTLLSTGNAAAAVIELEKARELKVADDEVLPKLARAMLATGQGKKVTERFAETRLVNAKAMGELSAVVAAAFAAQGDRERSEAAVARALKADPKNSDARLLQARMKAGQGTIEEASPLFDALLADEPRNRDAWFYKGESLLRAGRSADAAQALKKALEIDAKFLSAYNALLPALLQLRDTAEFKARTQQMKAALPTQPDTRQFEAQVALLDKDFAKARQIVAQLLRDIPENPRLLQLGGAIELAAGDFSAAELHLTKAVRALPRMAAPRRMLAQAYLRGDQSARALGTLQPLLEQEPDVETLALAGEAYLQNGQLKESENYLLRAAKIKPDDIRVRTAMALNKIARNNVDAGIADLEALSAADETTYTDLALITARMRRNDIEGALQDVARLEVKLPAAPLPHHLRGSILLKKNDVAGARASFEKGVAADPSHVPSIASLAMLDVADKHLDVAIKRLEALLAREPGNYRAALAIAELKAKSGAAPQEIRKLLSDAIRANPSAVAPRTMLVEYLLARRDIDGARSAAQETTTTLPDDPRGYEALGKVQMAAQDTQQAITSFTKATALQPDSAIAHEWLAQAQLANKDLAAARRSLNRALEINPSSLQVQATLVRLALADKRPDEALKVARAVQKQHPTEANGHLLESEVMIVQQRWDPALAALRTAMERQKSTSVAIQIHATLTAAGRLAEAAQWERSWLADHAKDGIFLSYLGAIALDRRLYAEAESRFRSVIELDPDNVNALNNVAWSMTQQGKKGALPLAEKANALTPNQPGLMDTLAEALAAEGQFPKALEVQRKALARSGDHPNYRLHLAKLLIASGDHAAARSELVTLAKLGAKFSGRAEALKLLQTL